MLLAEVVATSARVGSSRSRTEKVVALAGTITQALGEPPHHADDVAEVTLVVGYLAGSLRQRRTGLGWRGLGGLPEPAAEATLGVVDVDAAFERLAGLAGAGSRAARTHAVGELFARATVEEQQWLRGAITGEVRQGALDAVVQEALAKATGVGLNALRRAAMLAGSTTAVVPEALAGEEALAGVGLEVGRPVQPMLASSAPDVAAAMRKAAKGGGAVAIDTKLDGIRIQVHRDGDEVLVATRSLEDITARLPEVVDLARSLPAQRFVLDGEALSLDEGGRPRPFQETASRTASGVSEGGAHVTAYFFDVLHVDGRDLLTATGTARADALAALVPAANRPPRVVTEDPDVAAQFVEEAIAAGHEGVVVKSLDAPWEAGRRGSGWVKVKPVHTLDLVVIAIEWGSGRRRGWLSNLHLAARDDAGRLVMLGKTFKGMTDEMLTWQTERFLELETSREGHVLHVRPEQVVEIAFDGVQRSTRYPGGVALRFARVVRYREDKSPGDADTISTVRAFL